MRIFRRAWLTGLLAVAACGHGSPASPRQVGRLGLDGVVVRSDLDPLTGLSTYDADTLFHHALEADRAERFEAARALYLRLLEEFPGSRLRVAARYNLGLMHERAEAHEEAVEHYGAITSLPAPDSAVDRRTWLNAHFRLGVCAGKAGAWWRAYDAFDEVLTLDWIDDIERLEALVGSGIAVHEAGEPKSAELIFSHALLFYRDVSRERRFDDRGLAAEAAYRMGEIAREEYGAVRLEFPQELLEERLEQKCELLLSAQSRYLRAIHYGDAHTAAVAGLRIGELYESLYGMIVKLEAPPELTVEQVQIYHEEVRSRLMVLVKKALLAYERSLAVGKRASTAAPWVARLEAAVERLRAVYLAQEDAPETAIVP